MRQHIIVIAILVFLAGALWLGKGWLHPHPSAYAGYAFDSLIWICAIAAIVWLSNLLYLHLARPRTPFQAHRGDRPPNQRRTYRVVYPYQYRPNLVIDRTDQNDRRGLTFPILDLSQDGVRFKDDGSLGAAVSISGHIDLHDGKTLTLSGNIVRLDGTQICVHFIQSLPWSILLKEERRLLQIQPPKQV